MSSNKGLCNESALRERELRELRGERTDDESDFQEHRDERGPDTDELHELHGERTVDEDELNVYELYDEHCDEPRRAHL